MNEVLEMIGRVAGRPLDDPPRAGAEGRHARHLRRHVAGARRPRLRADGVARRGPRGGVSMAVDYCDSRSDAVELADARRSRCCRGSSRRWRRWRRVRGARAAANAAGRHAEPDKFLFERGTEDARRKKTGSTAREYFRQLIDTYPQSPYRPDAKLGVGDTYLGEGTSGVAGARDQRVPRVPDVLPDHARADYAQYKLGDGALPADARAEARPDRDARRDQGVRRSFVDALSEQRSLMPEAKAQAARGARSAERVGLPRRRTSTSAAQWYPGRDRSLQGAAQGRPRVHRAATRSTSTSPSRCSRSSRPAEALPYFERLVKEFEQSEYLERAQKRIAELKTARRPPRPPEDKP